MSVEEKILWLDATAGASGDMLLGALVDLGASFSAIERAVSALKIRGLRVVKRRVERQAVAATKVDVKVPGARHDDHHMHAHGGDGHSHGHGRTLADIRRIVAAASIAPVVRDRALVIFRRLVEAEGEAHGMSARTVHLHEAGASDAIADVVGVCVALHALSPDRIVVSPMTTGSGTVRCAHGLYPVPGPATSLLLRGAPLSGIDAAGERLTPTGAAILTSVANEYGGLPAMTVTAVGHGAGSRDDADRPNVVRAISGVASSLARPIEGDGPDPSVLVLEFSIDDATPQVLAYAVERLLAAGALDVQTAPVQMKKGRSGHHMTVLVRDARFDAVAKIALTETPTLGFRFRRERRVELDRDVETVKTRFGPIRVKVGRYLGAELHAMPEYDDCAGAAKKHGVPLIHVQEAALVGRRAGKPRRRR